MTIFDEPRLRNAKAMTQNANPQSERQGLIDKHYWNAIANRIAQFTFSTDKLRLGFTVLQGAFAFRTYE